MIWFQNRQVNHHNPDFALQQSAGVPGARLTGAIYMFQFDVAGWSRRSGKKRLPRFLTMVEYYPQLNHSDNPFVELIARSGTPGLELHTACGVRRRGLGSSRSP